MINIISHNLGSDHDESSRAENCPQSDAFIMGAKQSKLSRNAYLFSSCSIAQFKENLLNSDLS